MRGNGLGEWWLGSAPWWEWAALLVLLGIVVWLLETALLWWFDHE